MFVSETTSSLVLHVLWHCAVRMHFSGLSTIVRRLICFSSNLLTFGKIVTT